MSPELAMGSSRFDAVLTAGPVLLDGGLATQLEAQGATLSTALWSAQLLVDDPAAIVAAHTAFFAAGAQVATTASYQAPLPLIRESVRLAQQARDRVKSRGDTPRAPRDQGAADGDRWVAGSVGPYGPRGLTARSTEVTMGSRSASCGPGTGRGSLPWSRPAPMSWHARPSPAWRRPRHCSSSWPAPAYRAGSPSHARGSELGRASRRTRGSRWPETSPSSSPSGRTA